MSKNSTKKQIPKVSQKKVTKKQAPKRIKKATIKDNGLNFAIFGSIIYNSTALGGTQGNFVKILFDYFLNLNENNDKINPFRFVNEDTYTRYLSSNPLPQKEMPKIIKAFSTGEKLIKYIDGLTDYKKEGIINELRKYTDIKINKNNSLGQIVTKILYSIVVDINAGNEKVKRKTKASESQPTLKQTPTKKIKKDIENYIKKYTSLYNKIHIKCLDNEVDFNAIYVCNNYNVGVRPSEITEKLMTQSALISKKTDNSINDFILSPNKYNIIQGAGGVGKSMFMQNLMLTGLKKYKTTNKLPLLIPARDYIYKTIKDFLYSYGEYSDALINEYNNGNLIFLIDGLDELPSENLNNLFININNSIRENSNNGFILTSRPMNMLFELHSFKHTMLRKFSKDQIQKFVNNICSIENSKTNQAFYKKIDDDFIVEYEGLIETPLYLTLLLYINKTDKKLPKNRIVLYQRIFDLLYDKHDKTNKNIFSRKHSLNYSHDDTLGILSFYSFLLFTKKQRQCTKDELSNMLYQIKEKYPHIDTDNFIREFTVEVPMLNASMTNLMNENLTYSYNEAYEFLIANHILRNYNELKSEIVPLFIDRVDPIFTLPILPMLFDLIIMYKLPYNLEKDIIYPYLKIWSKQEPSIDIFLKKEYVFRMKYMGEDEENIQYGHVSASQLLQFTEMYYDREVPDFNLNDLDNYNELDDMPSEDVLRNENPYNPNITEEFDDYYEKDLENRAIGDIKGRTITFRFDEIIDNKNKYPSLYKLIAGEESEYYKEFIFLRNKLIELSKKYDSFNNDNIESSLDQYIKDQLKTNNTTQPFLIEKEINFKDIYIQNDYKINYPIPVEGGEIVENINHFYYDKDINYIIFGSGGIGKSMFMHNIMLENLISFREHDNLPIFIRARDYNGFTIETIINEILKPYALSINSITNHHILILIDGFDELKPDYIYDFISSIKRFKEKYPNANIIISSRPMNIIKSLNSFVPIDLEPFDINKCKMYVENLYKIDKDKSILEFINKITNNYFKDNIEILSTPLFLSLSTSIIKNAGTLPSSKALVYLKSAELLLNKFDEEVKNLKRQHHVNLNKDSLLDLLSYYAHDLFIHDKSYYSKEQIAYMLKNSEIDNYANIDSGDFILEFTTDIPFLKSIAGTISDEYDFIYKTYKEFFIAYFYYRNFNKYKDEFIFKLATYQNNGFNCQIYYILIELLKNIDKEINIENELIIPALKLYFKSHTFEEYILDEYPLIYGEYGQTWSWTFNNPSSYIISIAEKFYGYFSPELDLNDDESILEDSLNYYVHQGTEEVHVTINECFNNDTEEFCGYCYELNGQILSVQKYGINFEFESKDLFEYPHLYKHMRELVLGKKSLFKEQYNFFLSKTQ